jgi:hypothetical protein
MNWTNLARDIVQWCDGIATISLPTELSAPLIHSIHFSVTVFLSPYFSGTSCAFVMFPFSVLQTFERRSFDCFDRR